MTTRLEATVDLNLTRAQQQLAAFESDIRGLRTPIDVPVEIEGQQAFAEFRQDIQRAVGDGVEVPVKIDAEAKLAELRRDLGLAETQARAFGSATEGLDDNFRLISQSLGISEERAREMAREMGVARIRATQLDDSIKDVARAMGLSEKEASDLARQMQRVETETEQAADASSRFGLNLGKLKTALAGIVAGFGIREVVQQFNAAVTAASDLEQSIGGVQAIFGSSADEVLRFGQVADEAVGLAAAASNALASQLGAQLQSYGFSVAESATKTRELIVLGADLAATFGGPVNDAVAAIGSLLRGEINPIERYGVAVNQAAIQANALATGLATGSGELDIQTKALSALDLLYRQTGGAQGQFAREAETTAGGLERLGAEATNLQATFGEELVGGFNEGVDAIRGLLPLLERLAPAIGLIGDTAGAAVTGIAPFFEILADAGGDILEALGRDIEGNTAFQSLGEQAAKAISPIGLLSDVIQDITSRFQTGVSENELDNFLEQVADAAVDAEHPLDTLASAFTQLNDAGVEAGEFLEDLAGAAGANNSQLRIFAGALLANRVELGLTADEVEALLVLLREMQTITPGDDVARGRGGFIPEGAADEVRAFGDAFAEFDQKVADARLGEELAELEGGLPVVVGTFGELEVALRKAGISLTDFLEGDFTATGIVGAFSDAETAVLEVIASLDELPDKLETARGQLVAFFDVDVDAETGEISADTGAFVEEVAGQFQSLTDLEIDLSKIAITAPDVAAFLASKGLSAAGLAEALLGNEEDLAAAQEALSGSAEALAAGTAEDYATFLKTLTPQQLDSLGVFAADNFISPAVLAQIEGTAIQLGQDLADALDGLRVPANVLLDFTGAQITGLLERGGFGPTPIPNTGGGTNGGSRPPEGLQGQNVIITNINNPVSNDVGTSGSQASQQIAATVGLLAGRPS